MKKPITKPKHGHSEHGDFNVDRRLAHLSLFSLPIGCLSVILGYILIKAIAFFTNLFFFAEISFATRAPALSFGWWTALAPAIGGLIIGLMARFGSERIRGHGIPEAMEVILFGKSIMQPKVAILKPLSSAISIGSGGPFGAEGPIIMTGGAFGSLFGQLFHLSPAERKTLLVAGAAAGMTAIFGTPIAAVLLAVELLLFEWRPRSLIPVSLACCVAYLIRPYLMDTALPLFPIPSLAPLTGMQIASALPLGIIAGLCACLISTTLYKSEDLFGQLPCHWSWWPAIGGLGVGIIGCIDPRVFGVGYDLIGSFLQGDTEARSSLILITLKACAWIIALSSGTSGGILAPLLIIGAGLGSLLSPYFPAPGFLWPLAAMAALMGGIMRAPFTAILFALEVTYEVHSLPVLLISTIASYAVTVLIMKRSILTEKIARRGLDIRCEFEVDPLERQKADSAMSTSVTTINAKTSLSEVIAFFKSDVATHHGYPVVNDAGIVKGIITESDILQLSNYSPDHNAIDLVSTQRVIATGPDETCRSIAEKMSFAGIGRIPVVSSLESMELIGIITRSDLLKAMRSGHTEEYERETIVKRRKKQNRSL